MTSEGEGTDGRLAAAAWLGQRVEDCAMGTSGPSWRRRRKLRRAEGAWLWGTTEMSALQQQVRSLGCCWTAVQQHSLLLRFSTESLRAQWRRMLREGGAATATGSVYRVGGVRMWQPAALQWEDTPAAAAAVEEPEETRAVECEASRPRAEGIGTRAAADMAVLRLESEGAQTATIARGTLPMDNSWAQAVNYRQREASARRAMPAEGCRLQQYVRLWRLNECANGNKVLLCDYQRAERIVYGHTLTRRKRMGQSCTRAAVRADMHGRSLTVQERDGMGMVFYPGDVLTTLLARGARRWYVGGPGAGAGGLLLPNEAARLMGMAGVSRRRAGMSLLHSRAMHRAWYGIAKAIPAKRQSAVIMDSIDMGMAQCLMRRAANRVRAVRDRCRGRCNGSKRAGGPIRYASIGGGGCDALFHALRAVTRTGATHEWTAEWDEDRQRAISVAAHTTRIHKQALSEAVAAEARVDVVGITWSCRGVSSGPRRPWAERVRNAWRTAAQMANLVDGYVARALPSVVVIETAVGLATHFRGAHKWLNRKLLRLPYTWETGVFDAKAFGARHRRRRVLWVGTYAA